jgi:hypothetical protein
MLVEAIRHPIRYRLVNGRDVRLAPGVPVDLPDTQAQTLLMKAPDRVRVVESEPGPAARFIAQPTGDLQPVYWESHDKRIRGPARVTHIAKETTASGLARFWLCISYDGSWVWVHEHLLRSRLSFDAQALAVVQR